MRLERLHPVPASARAGEPLALRADLWVDEAVVFEPDLEARLLDAGGRLLASARLRDVQSPGWLPRGSYRVHWLWPDWQLPGGRYCFELGASQLRADGRGPDACGALEFEAGPGGDGGLVTAPLQIDSLPGTPELASLSWSLGHADWFFRHFDHAACTVMSYMLGDHPLLRGRVLDVGCGDGIISLGLALRCEPELLVGIDPFPLFERLPEMVTRAGLPVDCIPTSLRFEVADANHLPFADDSFDVVVSWGSFEHIAGGYTQALAEVRRVLRNGGLFFATPGLYYSKHGSHLAEFCAEPYFHLRHGRDEIERIVRTTTPQRMDRCGHVATPDEYLRWYDELNPVTVDGFERDLRALGFEPWRVAVRSEPRVDLTPDLARFPILDLALSELYISCWNRKLERPSGYRARSLDQD